MRPLALHSARYACALTISVAEIVRHSGMIIAIDWSINGPHRRTQSGPPERRRTISHVIHLTDDDVTGVTVTGHFLMNVSASVLVRVSGPDARRSRGTAAGYKVHEGATAFLSCSGVLLAPPPRPAAAVHRQFVVCCGAALAPFVQAARAHLPCAHDALIAGTEVHILHEGALVHTPLVTPNASAAAWRACRLHHLDDVPHVQDAVDILTAGGAGAWRVGWSKSDDVANVRPGGGSTEDAHQRFSVAPNGVRIRASLMAILEVLPIAAADAHLPHAQLHATAAHLQRGDTLLIVSSPYGLLSPRVFQNTVSRGIVANAIAPLSHSLVSEPIAHSVRCNFTGLIICDASFFSMSWYFQCRRTCRPTYSLT